MSGTRFLSVHRSWEDGVGMLIGVLIGLSPWLAAPQYQSTVVWNAGLTGLCVLGLAQLDYVRQQRWKDIGQIACGLWLIASPFVFDYWNSGALPYWHLILGAFLVMIAALELWQDRTTSAEALDEPGRSRSIGLE